MAEVLGLFLCASQRTGGTIGKKWLFFIVFHGFSNIQNQPETSQGNFKASKHIQIPNASFLCFYVCFSKRLVHWLTVTRLASVDASVAALQSRQYSSGDIVLGRLESLEVPFRTEELCWSMSFDQTSRTPSSEKQMVH